MSRSAPSGDYARGMDGEQRRSRIRSFVLGGLLGASAVLATVRRRRAARGPAPVGLAAFEEAPCFKETVERERQKPS
jgi:hypothetical protein